VLCVIYGMIFAYMPEHVPGQAQSPESYAAAYAAAQLPEEWHALFYQLLGDYRQAQSDATAALELAADAEASVAMVTATEVTIEDPEVEELREKVAELLGSLSTAEQANKRLNVAKRAAEDRATQAEADAQHIKEFTDRTIKRLSGKVRVLEGHICEVKDVSDLHFIGVVGTARVYAHNSVPGKAKNVFLLRQGTDEHGLDTVRIRYFTFPGDLDIEFASIDTNTSPDEG